MVGPHRDGRVVASMPCGADIFQLALLGALKKAASLCQKKQTGMLLVDWYSVSSLRVIMLEASSTHLWSIG